VTSLDEVSTIGGTIYNGQLRLNYRSNQKSLAAVSHCKNNVQIVAKKINFGRFFTNSSGRPDWHGQVEKSSFSRVAGQVPRSSGSL
jgi:hypothetical protein